MARKRRRKKIEERDIQGLKYFDKLAPLLERLHDDGCARDKAGNRELHYDQYCLLILLYLFNPVVTSLRGLQQASELAKVQKKLGCPRASLGSFSEAANVFDPDRLREIVNELGAELQPLGRDPRLRDVPGAITAVDGTLLSALPRLMQASCLKRATGSGYVCRLRDNSAYTVLETKPLTDADRALNVLSDQIVDLGSSRQQDARPDHPLRLLEIQTTPHTSRGKYRGGSTGPASDGILRIATNLLDVPAEVIALIFIYRWTIEIFFRFFKHVLGCRHLLSHNQRGIEIQTYCAIIACMLISLWTGRKPTLRTYEMICFYFSGLASKEELLAHIAKLKARDEAAQKI
jgi:hypothetical protein